MKRKSNLLNLDHIHRHGYQKERFLDNLAQQDMVAFRFTMRMGAAIPNPVNRVSGQLNSASTNIVASASAYPFAIITKTAAGSN